MKKIKVSFKKPKDNGDDSTEEPAAVQLNVENRDILMQSKRKYQNIVLRNVSFVDSEFYLEFLAARAGSWKSVQIDGCKLKNIDTMSEILKITESAVEELLIDNCYCPCVQIDGLYFVDHPTLNVTPELSFPRLKFLRCDFLTGSNMFRHFVHCTGLTKFHFGNLDSRFTPNVLTILSNNHELKDLQTDSDVIAAGHSFGFKLQKLRVDSSNATVAHESLLPFLEAHAQTLDSLELHVHPNKACLDLILGGMPKLTSFSMNFFDVNEAELNEGQPLPLNTTITTFKMGDISDGNRKYYETLIGAMRGFKQFKASVIDDELLLFLAQSVPALETMETVISFVTRLPEEEIFPNIQKFQAKSFNGGMPEPTFKYKFALLMAAEMRERPENALISMRRLRSNFENWDENLDADWVYDEIIEIIEQNN